MVRDLDVGNFDSTLSALPADHPVLLEFYASWCPACRLFTSTYAEVGQVIGSIQLKPQVLPGAAAGAAAGAGPGAAAGAGAQPAGAETPLVARVDCAKETKLCNAFRVPAYPYVTAGTAGTYLKRMTSAVRVYPSKAPRGKQDIVRWAAQTLQLPLSDASMAAAGMQPAASHAQKAAAALQEESFVWTMSDVESSTLYLYRQVIMADPALHTGPEKRAALRALLQLWAAGHPSPRCQGPSQVLTAFFDNSWPESEQVAPEKIREYQICGEVNDPEHWIACAGSIPGSRGFTCGLWLMFHTCAHRLPYDGERGVTLMTALRAFNDNFFPCQVCQKHFAKILDSPEAKAVRTQQQATLWLWRVHNEVNARLQAVESKYGHSSTGDPAHPKHAFPSVRACPKCHAAAATEAVAGGGSNSSLSSNGGGEGEPSWNLDEVYEFLERAYMIESQLPTATASISRSGDPWHWARPLPFILGTLAAVVALMLLLTFGCNAVSLYQRRVGPAGGLSPYAPHRARGHGLKGPLV